MTAATSIRFDFSSRVFEVSGTKEHVDEYLERYSNLLEIFQDQAKSVAGQTSREGSAAPSQDVPAEFGEYFHRFRDNISDVDRVLVAGYFVQKSSDRNLFTTREANDLLLNQNVKVANASEGVRRALGTRRVFSVSKNEYRVSSQGIDHIRSLQERSAG